LLYIYIVNLLIHTIVKICVIAVHEVSAARELIKIAEKSQQYIARKNFDIRISI